MSWRDGLLPASFRDVGFSVEAHENGGGRRIALHEYPGREESFPEDVGRRAQTFQVEAFIVGDDYMERRDALADACDRPGPGVLVHPYRGRREVSCERWTLSERASDGRMCRFTLEFVEAGRNRYPTDRADAGVAAASAATAARQAIAADLREGWLQ